MFSAPGTEPEITVPLNTLQEVAKINGKNSR
jgi:hypothetical protein